ncbi:YfiT family bacillithiol transferase [Lysinibacillus antri]|uniref:Putative metal-dependent hydrolase n=1 Tax=Lysinibacillus antri TaxID=2498145 RepID=A0A432LCJ7_9BACI|nr:putative metal-dependent hydrolase [Lysinibacillus antri]RUL53564.1 putative metal-dependent hydrolase [Lysinibacillus antri]
MSNMKYPIGQFEAPTYITREQLNGWITDISNYPDQLMKVVGNIKEDDLNRTYREGAWTIKQLVHHIADAQLNYYMRIKLALTENNPTIKPFEENEWAQLPDTELPIAASLKMIAGMNERLAYLLQSITDDQFKTIFTHPIVGIQTIQETIAFCVWHTNHHLAHIKNALKDS